MRLIETNIYYTKKAGLFIKVFNTKQGLFGTGSICPASSKLMYDQYSEELGEHIFHTIEFVHESGENCYVGVPPMYLEEFIEEKDEV